MADGTAGEDPFDRLWQEFLEGDMNRFRAMHQKARADAGPSMIAGARGIEHWTFDWVRRANGYCLQEASTIVLAYAARMNETPAALVQRIRPSLRAQQEHCFALLEREFDGPPVNEFAVRPSREALNEARRHVSERTERALAALTRGRMDPGLEPSTAWYAGIVAAVGGGQRLLLYGAVVAFVLAMWATL